MGKQLDKQETVTDGRFVSSKSVDDDFNYDVNLRPRGFDEYIGQDRVREVLHVAIPNPEHAPYGIAARHLSFMSDPAGNYGTIPVSRLEHRR